MEKIKVNMTPIEEAKTIHASQNDNATRKWAFDLYDENGKIDSSDIKEQMIFDSRVGGTEQILPENTSDPTTSPIIADIQYPDSLRSDQIFTYRESPTQEDGQAKIKRIQGNTVSFNQLIQNGNFADTTGWNNVRSSFIVSNNTAIISVDTFNNSFIAYAIPITDVIVGHKYYLTVDYLSSKAIYSSVAQLYLSDGWSSYLNINNDNYTANQWKKYSGFFVSTGTSIHELRLIAPSDSSYTHNYKNVMLFDLTLMGIDNFTTTAEVEAWLSSHIGNLPYYDYTQGKLLPFKGESLKTTGENLFDINDIQIGKNWIYGSASDRAIIEFDVEPNTSYTICIENYSSFNPISAIYKVGYVGYQISNIAILSTEQTIITPQDCHVLCIQFAKANISMADFYSHYICALANTFSTLSLPTLNYFPTGMKRTGSVYDEITESKAITRLISYTITGNETVYRWENNTSSAFGYHYGGSIVLELPVQNAGNVGLASGGYTIRFQNADKTIYFSNDKLIIIDDRYTTRDAWIAGITGVEVILPLITETEQRITTASLVTEKGEAPLYYDDELIADCNETISSESGMFDVKIKLMDDETIYSQKIQLHVERKPQ